MDTIQGCGASLWFKSNVTTDVNGNNRSSMFIEQVTANLFFAGSFIVTVRTSEGFLAGVSLGVSNQHPSVHKLEAAYRAHMLLIFVGLSLQCIDMTSVVQIWVMEEARKWWDVKMCCPTWSCYYLPGNNKIPVSLKASHTWPFFSN